MSRGVILDFVKADFKRPLLAGNGNPLNGGDCIRESPQNPRNIQVLELYLFAQIKQPNYTYGIYRLTNTPDMSSASGSPSILWTSFTWAAHPLRRGRTSPLRHRVLGGVRKGANGDGWAGSLEVCKRRISRLQIYHDLSPIHFRKQSHRWYPMDL